MKTTVELPDSVNRQAKAEAALGAAGSRIRLRRDCGLCSMRRPTRHGTRTWAG